MPLMSCRHSYEERAQGTAAQIARAVEALRLASTTDKLPWLRRLQGLPCQSDDVCQLKTLCTEAYEAHLAGVELLHQASSIMGTADAGAEFDKPDASAEVLLNAMSKAQAGQRKLKLAKQQTRACAENEAVIRQRYRL